MATMPSNSTRFQPPSATERAKAPIPIASVAAPRSISSRSSTLRTASLFALPNEPEDARLTGGTRSLERRLLALNLARVDRGADAA